MCIVYFRPFPADGQPFARLDPAHADEGSRRNPEGFGIMWADGGTLNVQRFAPAERPAFLAALAALDARDVAYGAHARIKTHGPATLDLTHPFLYTQEDGVTVGVMHNGVINIATRPDESDTQVFVRDVLATLPAYWWRDGALRFLVAEAIGWSKLLVMTSAGESIIINESDGTWDGGIWRSNLTYKVYAYTPKVVTAPAAKPATAQPAATPHKSRAERKAERNAQRAEARKRKAHSRSLTVVGRATPGTLPASVADLLARPAAGKRGHMGHSVTVFADLDKSRDAEYMSAVACDMCRTIGDAYVIDGGVYLDLAHTQPYDGMPF